MEKTFPSTDEGIVKNIKKIYICIDEMEKTARENEKREMLQKIKKLLAKTSGIKDSYEKLIFVAKEYRKAETILHFAVRKLSFTSEYETEVIILMTKTFKKLVNAAREGSEKFSGQTPLHIAITKGVHKIIKYLIPRQMDNVLSQIEFGPKFKNTVMMAEIPLSVAALKSVASNKTAEDLEKDQDVFKTLLELGAKLDGENSNGDNVCHSLIRYAKLYPDKCKLVIEMMRYITEDKEIEKFTAEARNIWLLKNHEGLTPLLLATKLGQHEIFKFITDLKVSPYTWHI